MMALHDCAHRKRNCDALLPVAVVQAFHELVLDQVLIDELARPHDHREVDAGFAKRVISDEQFELSYSTWNGPHDVSCHVACNPFDVIEVTVVIDANVHEHSE